MNVIDIIALEKSYGVRKILDGVTFAVGEEEKVGLIGANGCGKSTLLRILGRLEDSDGGSIATRRGARIGYLSQEPVLDDDLTVAEEIEKGLVEIRQAVAEYEEVGSRLAASPPDMQRLVARQGELSNWIEHHGGWNTDYRITQMMDRLGLRERGQRIGELSGGTRRRVALARLLLEAPDLLLLDEPTNHLDADTTAWLQEYLRGYEGAVMLVTHDRYFLDKVVGRMLELERGVLASYNGGYSSYVALKAEQMEQESRANSRLLNLLRVETAWMQRGAKARTTKQKARIDRFTVLREEAVPTSRRETKLEFTTETGLGGTILELLAVSKGYGQEPLMEQLTLRMKRGDRIGIIGPNGAGKSTLFRMITGQEKPDSGEVEIGQTVKLAYVDQSRDALRADKTVFDEVAEGRDILTVGRYETPSRAYLGRFNFKGGDQQKRVGNLSGGERGRLHLAKTLIAGGNVLLLDEPSNDLDVETLRALEDALLEFAGCVLVISHDRWFLDRIATHILAFEGDSQVTFFPGNYQEYEADKKKRLGEEGAKPKRIRYKPISR